METATGTLDVPQPEDPQRTLGVNLRVNPAQQVGVTWLVSPSVTLRPSLSISWDRITQPVGSEIETTQFGVDLDVLLPAATWDRVMSYYGVGGSIARLSSDSSDATVWSARAFLGVRVAVLERMAVFGEVGLAFYDTGAFGTERVALATFPLGVVISDQRMPTMSGTEFLRRVKGAHKKFSLGYLLTAKRVVECLSL